MPAAMKRDMVPLIPLLGMGGNSQQAVHEVGRKQANEWGLHDMIGNVRERRWDVYGQLLGHA